MKARRRLGDLYARGKEVPIDDGSDDPVVVWIQKLNEVERDAVLRRANATMAQYMIDSDNEQSETFKSTYGSVRDYLDRDAMVEVIIGEDISKARRRVEAVMIADETGWGKNGYIQGLADIWTGDDDNPGLAARWAEDPADPEAARVKTELDRYNEELEATVAGEVTLLTHEWDNTPLDELVRLTAHELLKRRGEEVFMTEWSRQQIYDCVREPTDHHKRYFGSVAEIDDLDDRVRKALSDHSAALFVGVTEGKESPPSPDSSNSSEPSSAAEPSTVSGPEAAPV
jgi:hypothetical protein